MNISDLRNEYNRHSLSEKNLHIDPVHQFEIWFQEALAGNVNEPSAMHLSTASPDGRPSGRIVLLKGLSEEGFIFFTNYHSKKGKQLAVNPYAALTFFWPELERQVRIEGMLKKTDEEASEEYFRSRPRLSQLSTAASEQSEVVESREFLEEKLQKLEGIYADKEVIRPPHWGGYILKPELVEFWQGRPGRLHDRIQYTLLEENAWKVERLSP